MPFAQKHVVLDSPVNNFATLNPLYNSSIPLSDGNLATGTFLSSAGSLTSSMQMLSNAITYFEIYYETSYSDVLSIGLMENNNIGSSWGIRGDGEPWNNAPQTAVSISFTAGDVLGVIVDVPNSKWYLAKNGSLQLSANISNGTGYIHNNLTSNLSLRCWNASSSGSQKIRVNFGQNPTFSGEKAGGGRYSDANGLGQFYYKPPWGALALCSANIEKNEIYAAKERADQHFKPVIWSGDDQSSRDIDVNFRPDFVWIKQRNKAYTSGHQIYDSVRGLGPEKELNSSSTNAEGAGNIEHYGYPSEFLDNGFKVVKGTASDTSTLGITYVNRTGVDYVAWSWKAGGAPDEANTAMVDEVGTTVEAIAEKAGADITPTAMSVNTKAGFSIVKYVGNGSSGQTVPHGLTKPPEFYTWKRLDDESVWGVVNTTLDGSADYLNLNDTVAKVDIDSYSPTSSTMFISMSGSGLNVTDADYIVYTWHSVPGYSKFGSYTGKGNADGPFVHTGFKPAFVMVKNVDTASSEYASWTIFDTARDPHNPTDWSHTIFANRSAQEGKRGNETDANFGTDAANPDGGVVIDILSNGFKTRDSGSGEISQSGKKYIYMAFAEAPPTVPEPVKYSPKKERHALRFDGSSYLSRNFSAGGNRKTWTWSGWVKFSDLGSSEQFLFQSSDAVTATSSFKYQNNTLKFYDQGSGSAQICNSNALYRDSSSWHHIVVFYNTLLSGNTIKFYVNGNLLTLSGSTPTTNTLGYINYSNYEHRIGAYTGNSLYFNGYLADIHFIDGQALGPEHFGKTENGIWEPKHYQGSYGRNGFFLDFHPENLEYKADGTLDYVKDSSGNGNHWNGN